MLYPQEFFIRHRQLRESADTVLVIYNPICKGKSWVEMVLTKQRTTGKVGCFQMYLDDFCYKCTKLLRSKSKQSRMVAVVCK